MVVPQLGSAFWTYAEAANRLGRTKRTVVNYVRRGLLRRVVRGGVNHLAVEEVEQLALELADEQPAINKKSFGDLSARVRKIEETLAMVSEMLQLKRNPLRPSLGEASGLLDAAGKSLAAGVWEEKEITLWSGYFSRLDELTFEVMCKASKVSQPWVPFFRLCTVMLEETNRLLKEDPTVSLLQSNSKLQEGQRHLRAVAVVWMETHRGVTSEEVLHALSSTKEGLVKRLTKGSKN